MANFLVWCLRKQDSQTCHWYVVKQLLRLCLALGIRRLEAFDRAETAQYVTAWTIHLLVQALMPDKDFLLMALAKTSDAQLLALLASSLYRPCTG
jgi:hypothetical protein